MDFHGIKMQGPIWVQVVSSLPTWTSNDEGRLIYNTDDDKLYIGTASDWQEVGSGAGLTSLEIRPTDMDLSEDETGADTGIIFEIIDTVDFSPVEAGTIFTSFKLPDGWDTDKNINIKAIFSMNGDDSGKNVRIETRAYITHPGGSSQESSPDSMGTDLIASSSSNIGKISSQVLTNGAISSSHLTNADDVVTLKITRNSTHSDDTYSGTFQLISLIVYQS